MPSSLINMLAKNDDADAAQPKRKAVTKESSKVNSCV